MPRPAARVLTYALAIALPTLVLLAFGLSSVRRQQQAIAQLEAANLRLMADQAARSLAGRVSEAAASCLRDPAWPAIVAHPTSQAVAALRRRHPVARDLILVSDGEVVHPRLVSPVQLSAAQSGGTSCGAALERAEAAEFAGQVRAALATYRHCLTQHTVDADQRPGILARVARAERRLGNEAAAIEAYEALASRHADAPDRFSRPFGLVAALELHDLRAPTGTSLLRRARADLALGRWDLSDEQARYFLEEFEARLGGKLPPDAPAPFLRTLDVARAIQEALPLASLVDAAVHQDEVLAEGRRTRIHHAVVSAGGPLIRAVLVPDPTWIEGQALSEVARDFGLPGGTRILTGESTTPGDGLVASADGALAPWRVWVPTGEAIGRSRWAPVALQGAITLLVSGVLAFGVMLVVRDVRRDQSVAQMRSQFVSAASHELRTPLAMILLYAQTLLEDVDADRDERRGSYEIIAEESERLRHLLDKVLDFSRIDAGRRSYRFVTADLDASVRAAVRLFEPHLHRRGFTLEQYIASVPDMRHDPEAVTGAVLNLLENAAKYSDRSRLIHLHLARRGDEALIEVRDHGIGIPAEDVPHIGQQFFRSSLSTSIGGYGLGLYLVQHAMMAHGGRMDVSSRPGEGSTFTLVLPVVSGRSKEVSA